MAETDLNLLIALDALLAEGGVTGAARRLGLSASAMSRTLTRLRVVTGDPLLVRAGRLMLLTPHAEALRERTQAMVQEARALLRPAETTLDPSRLERTFTLRSNDGFVEVFAARLIAAAARLAPRVRLRFAPKAEKSAGPLREGLVDLEIGVLSRMGPEVRIQGLFRDRFVGLVRQHHPLANKRSISVKRYIGFGHVVASRQGRASGPVDDALAALGLQRQIVAVVPSFHAVLSVVQASDLIGLVPASLLADAATVHAFELPITTPPITVSLMWHPRLDADPAHRWLRQLVLSTCRARVGR